MNAKAIWVKKQVNFKQKAYFDSIPAYLTLYTSDNGAIVAFRIIDTDTLPESVTLCDVTEVQRLEKERTKEFVRHG